MHAEFSKSNELYWRFEMDQAYPDKTLTHAWLG